MMGRGQDCQLVGAVEELGGQQRVSLESGSAVYGGSSLVVI